MKLALSLSVLVSGMTYANAQTTPAPTTASPTTSKPTSSPTTKDYRFYPDWAGANEGCKNDGNMPAYMKSGAQYYLFTDRSKCCSQHYNWMYDYCMGIVTGGPVAPTVAGATTTTTVAKFYPDWAGANKGCKNDGKQPAYMNSNGGAYLYTSQQACCNAHYGWMVNDCMGIVTGGPVAPTVAGATTTTTVAKFYPDWQGANEGCKNDGKQPAYMNSNGSPYLYTSQQACCNAHYGWMVNNCMGIAPTGVTATTTPYPIKWYPDWAGANTGCLNGTAPAYMYANGGNYLFNNLNSCCLQHYNYNLQTCSGSGSNSNGTSPSLNQYFPDWAPGADKGCKQDTTGSMAPAYMTTKGSNYLFTTLDACCSAYYSYRLNECKGLATSTGSTTTAKPVKCYPQWPGNNGCLCDSNYDQYVPKYSTKSACCGAHFSWKPTDCLAF